MTYLIERMRDKAALLYRGDLEPAEWHAMQIPLCNDLRQAADELVALRALAQRVAEHFADTDSPLGIDARAKVKETT